MAKGRGAAREGQNHLEDVSAPPRQVQPHHTEPLIVMTDEGVLNLKALKSSKITELASDRARLQRRRRDQHAQAGDDLFDPPGASRQERIDPRRRRARNLARRLRLPARSRLQLSARPRRYLHLAEPDPEVQSAHRRHGLGPDSSAQRGRALFRAAQGRIDQFRGSGKSARQDPVRQPDPALSDRNASSSNTITRT